MDAGLKKSIEKLGHYLFLVFFLMLALILGFSAGWGVVNTDAQQNDLNTLLKQLNGEVYETMASQPSR